MDKLFEGLSPREYETYKKLYNQYKKNKRKFVQDYGKDAAKVMNGRAIKLAKNIVDKENKNKVIENIKKVLIKEVIDSTEYTKNRVPFKNIDLINIKNEEKRS